MEFPTLSEIELDEAEKYGIISAILSLISYTIVLFLYISSMYFLLRTPSVTNNHMRRFLPIFATVMFTIGTFSMVFSLLLDFVYPVPFFSSQPNSIKDGLCSFCNCKSIRLLQDSFVILAIWAADGFMIWKCVVVYYFLSKTRRIIFLSFCWLMVILSFVVGVLYTIPSTRSHITLTLFSFITLIINVSITSLIVGRLFAHRKVLKDSFGPGHDSPYIEIIVICVESATLAVIFNVIFVVFSFVRSSWSLVLLPTLVQVYVINPLMIIFLVAFNRNRRNRELEEWTPTAVDFGPSPHPRHDLEFSKSMSSKSMSTAQPSIMHLDFSVEKTNPFEDDQYSCSASPSEADSTFHQHSTFQ